MVSRGRELAGDDRGLMSHSFPPAALRYFRACLKTNNHFIIRHLPKQDLILPLIELLETEGPSDNMLSSACLEVFEIIRKVGDTDV
jgi:hypothetical protein